MRALRNLVRSIAESPHPPRDAPALAAALSAASAVYGAVSAARRELYALGVFRATRVPAPVVSVGNVTWGGSGKTPMTEYLARVISDAGHAPTILSRGYRGADEAGMLRRRLADVPDALVLVGADRARLARDALSGRAPSASTAPVDEGGRFSREKRFAGDVDVDDVELRCVEDQWRVDSGTRASSSSSSSSRPPPPSSSPTVSSNPHRDHRPSRSVPRSTAFVLDDGAQHLRLHRDLEVVTVNALAGWGSGALVPRGPLRERPEDALARADVVALHHLRFARERDPHSAAAFERDVRAMVPEGRLVVATEMRATRVERLARYAGFSPRHEWNPPLTRLRGSKILCVCGVGSPEALEATLLDLVAPAPADDLRGFGLRARDTGSVELMRLGDHEPFRTSDLVDAAERFREMHAASGEVGGAEVRLVLTEKDVARMRAAGARKMHEAFAALAPADPFVLSAELVVPRREQRDALTRLVRKTLGGHPYGDTNR